MINNSDRANIVQFYQLSEELTFYTVGNTEKPPTFCQIVVYWKKNMFLGLFFQNKLFLLKVYRVNENLDLCSLDMNHE